ncbi:MAG TPA: hypothetical protein DEQ02_08465 [Ruminococcaceae bacterium]|nr:hypothetical protein [Oscillospiraceae bacterium]
MNDANRHISTAASKKSDENRQIRMKVDGGTVKLNLLPGKDGTASIETVKKLILNGLAKV